MKNKILITLPAGEERDTFFTQQNIDVVESVFDVTWNNDSQQLTNERFARELAKADGCITGWHCPLFSKEILDNAPNLRFIGHCGGSLKSFITLDVFEREIKVVNANHIMAESVAEQTLCLILCSLRDVENYQKLMKQEKGWKERIFGGKTFYGKKLGLIGLGTVGRILLELTQRFHTTNLVYDPYVDEQTLRSLGAKPCGLVDLLVQSDVISIHAAKTRETAGLIDEAKLSMIKEGALLVNTARGAIVDQRALTKQLQKGRFFAALDVYEKEPLDKDSELRDLENVLLFPHVSGPTIDRRKDMAGYVIDNAINFFRDGYVQHPLSKRDFLLMTES